MLSRRTAVFYLLALPIVGVEAQARPLNGRYFVVVWGFQGPSGPTLSHTFAVFYRGDDLAAGSNHGATISWYPASGTVRFGGVEKGRNMSLGETLALARRHHYRLASYGPYEISAKTYASALARVRLLNSGKVAYAMLGGGIDAMNCIQAVGSVAGSVATGLAYGPPASAMLANHLALNRGQVDPDAAARLGLKRQARAD